LLERELKKRGKRKGPDSSPRGKKKKGFYLKGESDSEKRGTITPKCSMRRTEALIIEKKVDFSYEIKICREGISKKRKKRMNRRGGKSRFPWGSRR